MYTSCHKMKMVFQPALHLDQSWAWAASLPATGDTRDRASSLLLHAGPGASWASLFILRAFLLLWNKQQCFVQGSVPETYISLQPIFYFIQRDYGFMDFYETMFFQLKFIVINRIKPKKNCHGLFDTKCQYPFLWDAATWRQLSGLSFWMGLSAPWKGQMGHFLPERCSSLACAQGHEPRSNVVPKSLFRPSSYSSKLPSLRHAGVTLRIKCSLWDIWVGFLLFCVKCWRK